MAADTAVQQEINQVKQDPSTPSKINAAYSEMIRRASDPSTSEQLVKGVQDLFDRSMAMSSSFERIKLELGKLDERGIKNSDGTPLEKLKPTWAEFQKRYTYTMWGSRDDATAASSVLKDFTEALCPILTDKSVSFADKKEALADFVLGRKIGTRSQAESFTKLFSDIDVFTTKLLNFADLRSTLLTTQIGKLNDDIKALNVQIAE
ncbi:hypothetical protein FRC12_000896 [Ceratobasidium sp. 428]|nr:hypothetical protein FRC12_000896 [Ceratobasidium sp. 428]